MSFSTGTKVVRAGAAVTRCTLVRLLRKLAAALPGEKRDSSVRCAFFYGLPVPGVTLMVLLGCAAGHPGSGSPVVDKAGNTPLILAAARGEMENVVALLGAGADVNATNREGTTPLIAATYGKTGTGDAGIARALIAHGANVNATNRSGGTALMYVAGSGNVEFVTLLLNAGADANARASDGETALHSAALNGRSEILTALLAGGAAPNVKNDIGQTPLMLACYCPAVRKSCSERPELVRSLLVSGADVNATDTRGSTALQWNLGGTSAERDEVRALLEAARRAQPRW